MFLHRNDLARRLLIEVADQRASTRDIYRGDDSFDLHRVLDIARIPSPRCERRSGTLPRQG
eukprot:7125718-Pyramimonas_sp.AAC.1